MVITKLALPRRTFIRGIGATVALPFLDAMVPAMRAQSAKAAPRFTAIYCGNGANMFDWTPATEGVGFEMSPSLKPHRAVSRSAGRRSPGWITSRRRTRATLAGSIRVPRRPS